MNVVGKNGSHILFSHEEQGIVVDVEDNVIVKQDSLAALVASAEWDASDTEVTSAVEELAAAAITSLDITVVGAGKRLYTIPKGAQEEAKRALEWRKEHKRGGTPVGLNTARTLARGGQIGIEKVRHIAKYFPRHEVDKKAEGYSPGEDGFPSNGRIAWALWGGDTAWRWARAIVERENKKAVKADGFADSNYFEDELDYSTTAVYDAELDAFEHNLEAVEFIARMRMDGTGIDRLYKVDGEYNVSVWDAGYWHKLDGVNQDLVSYDAVLDDEEDMSVEKVHIEIDDESAFFLSACFQEDPFTPVSVYDIDPEEASIYLAAESELDTEFLDRTIVSAAEADTDGNYTPEERSEKASRQVRDKTGKFAKQGSRIVVGGDPERGTGNIIAIDPANQTVRVKFDSGNVLDVPATATEPVDAYTPVKKEPLNISALDTSGILGEPRVPIDRPEAKIPGTLPALTQDDISQVLGDWPGWVKSQRDEFEKNKTTGFKSTSEKTGPTVVTGKDQIEKFEKSPFLKELEKVTGVKLQLDPYYHPALSGFLNKKVKGSDGKYYYPNKMYYQPITSAAETAPGTSTEMTPETSDVQPLFFAIVSETDPSAVYELVSLVPASSSSTDAMTYIRRDKKWVRDEQVLSDMKSPTPPPVVPLDGESLKTVIEQVDGIVSVTASADDDYITVLRGPGDNIMFLTAAGGLDRNRGNAEKLRRYWTRGKGALKIRWGTKGDWSRCVRHLAKYLGPRAKGYCQLRHKEALGFYTATHAKKERGRNNSTSEFIMEEPFDPLTMKPFTDVTPEDMETPLDDILGREDDSFDSAWEPDEEIIVILMDKDLMDEECSRTVTAAGGLDRNRGNAERLRRYWTIGKGGVIKIRWNTPGDWTRCYRNLKKYMGTRAKGYCALRHKEMTGTWPGSKYNVGKKRGLLSVDEILQQSVLAAKANDARRRVLTAAGHEPMSQDGAGFTIPLVIPEGIETGDGRTFEKGAIEMRELPLPLLWQIETGEGHNGSVVVGRIDHMERVENGIGNARGVFDTGEYGKEAERLVRNGFIRGVSADLDQFEASQELPELVEKDSGKIGTDKLVISHARVMAVTLVPKPAFQECQIYLVEDENQEETVIPDGIYADEMDPVEASALVACGLVAGSIPVVPPRSWFDNPKLDKPTPLTVDDDGRVFGHIAAWHVDHIGMSFGTKPPRSKSNYAYFHTGVVRADDGKDVPVGQLTLAGGHASLEASATEAARHYDDTASAVADVHAGEDGFGIWVAGALRPGATPEQIRALRASAPSGDWRPIKGQLELVAVCQVNVPGFPIARARVASGAVMALVAAGAGVLARMKADPIADLTARIQKLEQLELAELSTKAQAAKDKFTALREAQQAELSARADALYSRVFGIQKFEDEFGYISREKRQALAKKGYALPDGSYPITSVDSLKDSIQAYGRSKPGKRAAVRRHIMKRARQLDRADLIPDKWKSLSSEELSEEVTYLRERISVLSASTATAGIECGMCKEYGCICPGCAGQKCQCAQGCACGRCHGGMVYSNEEPNDLGKASAAEFGKVEDVQAGKYVPGKTQPRDAKGKFRQVLARIKQDLGDVGLDETIKKIEEAENLDDAGNYLEAARAAGDVISIVDRIDTRALNPDALENIRTSARALGEAIANLPLPFGSDTEKVRYSDLPPALKGLIDDMISRVESKIGKDEADEATKGLKSFMSGGDYYSQSEVSSEMSKLLRLLT